MMPSTSSKQHRQHQRELDELGARFARPRRSPRPRPHHRSHNITTVPTRIGTAYASRGPRLVASVSSGNGLSPLTRQCASSSHTLLNAVLRYPCHALTISASDRPGDAGVHREPERVDRSEPRAEGADQLHVAGAHSTERVRRQQQRNPESPIRAALPSTPLIAAGDQVKDEAGRGSPRTSASSECAASGDRTRTPTTAIDKGDD